ncbi:hypothetical protein CEP52_017704, partial [Fusarium oligoseptatum]
MGRRALTAQQKADKASRERVRLRQYRSAPRLSNRAVHIDAHRLNNTNTPPSTLPGHPLPETQSDEINFTAYHHDLEYRDNATLHPTDDQPAAATPLATQPIVTTFDPVVIADDEAILRPIDGQTYPLTIEDQDETEPISAVDAAGPTFLAQYDEEQAAARPGRPRVDPAISPRARTRLRVQRHRDQQHLERVQRLVQEVAVIQELPPIVEFSALTLHDDSTPSPPAQIQSWSDPELEFEAVPLPLSSKASPVEVEDGHGDDTGSSSPDTNAVLLPTASAPPSPGLPRQDGQPSRPRGSTSPISDLPDWFLPSASPSLGPENLILDSFIQAIHDQDTAGGPDFLRARGDLYDRVLRTFFNHQCECKSSDPTPLSCRGAHIMLKLGPNSRELAEPEHTHTLQERIERLGHSLPPLPAVFAERNNACDPRASFPHWQSFLSAQPPEPLSFRKTQASLPHDSVTITRQWDVDSVWFGAKSLSAIRAPNQFRLSFFPPHKSNISTNQVIQPHGLDLAHTRHTCIGTFTTAAVRFSVFLFFPHGARSQTQASANSLSLARFRDLYDDIILPAVYET